MKQKTRASPSSSFWEKRTRKELKDENVDSFVVVCRRLRRKTKEKRKKMDSPRHIVSTFSTFYFNPHQIMGNKFSKQLATAAVSGDPALLEDLLLSADARVLSRRDADGWTLLHYAAAAGDAGAVAALLSHEEEPAEAARRRAKDGSTPLHLAASAASNNGVAACVSELLKAGAEADALDNRGRSPLAAAAAAAGPGSESGAVVSALVGAGADAKRSLPVSLSLSGTPMRKREKKKNARERGRERRRTRESLFSLFFFVRFRCCPHFFFSFFLFFLSLPLPLTSRLLLPRLFLLFPKIYRTAPPYSTSRRSEATTPRSRLYSPPAPRTRPRPLAR